MDAERLLAHYERIADAPDAIPRLRRFVLDLAVRGKLVPQDPNDEPASELLKRIAAEKARRVKEGTLREQKPLLPIKTDQVEFDLAPGWQWVRMAEVIKLWNGFAFKSADFQSSGIPVIRIGDLQDGKVTVSGPARVSEAVAKTVGAEIWIPPDALLIAMSGATTGKTAFNRTGTSLLLNQRVGRIEVFLMNVNFLRFFFETIVARNLSISFGTAIPNLSAQQINETLVPLPPLAEQCRIVTKVDELMELCDQLEATRAEREATRDKLTAASFARLNAPDPDTFRDDARFALDALPALTARTDQIKQLRQAILNLAVRGKLVPQDPNDEPASELLKQIAVEKARLVKAGKGKRQEPLQEPEPNQAPFDLPGGWAWARFPELGTFGRGKSKHRPRNDPSLFDGGTHLMIQTGDVARSKGLIDTYTNKYNDFGLSQSFKWPKGILCITIAANIADSGILNFDACFPDSVVGFIPASMFDNARYFEYFVRTAKANLLEFAPATAQKNINLEILTHVLIPLPPLAELRRIVAKVDELMARCDRLEASLTAADETRCRLLEALLTEALAPDKERELEAAE
jgi:type I restriction enzyme, S subunit